MDRVTVTEKMEGVWELEVRFERPVVGFRMELGEGMRVIHFPVPYEEEEQAKYSRRE